MRRSLTLSPGERRRVGMAMPEKEFDLLFCEHRADFWQDELGGGEPRPSNTFPHPAGKWTSEIEEAVAA